MNENSIDWQMSIVKRLWAVGLYAFFVILGCIAIVSDYKYVSIIVLLSAGFFLAMVIITDYYFFKYKQEKNAIENEKQDRAYRERKIKEGQERTSLDKLITIEEIENIVKYHGYYLQKGNGGEIVFKSNGHGNIFYDNHRMILQQNIIYQDMAVYSIALQAAAKATNGIMMAKINVTIPPDNPYQIGIIISVETLIHYIDELKINFSQYLDIMQNAEYKFEYEYAQIAKERQSKNAEIDQTDTPNAVIVN